MPRSFRLRSTSRPSGTPRSPFPGRVALTSSAVSVVLLATACGGGQASPEPGPAGAAHGPVEITYWSSSAGAQQTAAPPPTS
ncbi:hypothetical protein [Streptomyces sp. NBC_00539]|uniref:hypothetical protein n=1 Tax=Streptomyces sp. NBC_00539 TaxID=2975770 RepID=UPI002E81337E|nr:hypothetical protein [Streptomyces sp. NBC_00539]WUC63433.1 hypothetical protein OG861_03930 [Streptomyces sp. NBC_00539]